MPSKKALSVATNFCLWAKAELDLDKTYKLGVKGSKVKNIQEWLNFHGVNVSIDNDFGPATETGVRAFQQQKGLEADGKVGPITYAELVAPMMRALQPCQTPASSYAETVKAFALQHCAEHPIEIGGDNCGPWVRLYMKGNEGAAWYWCAGFVSFILAQAANFLGRATPISGSFSCDALAEQAKHAGLYLSGSDVSKMNPKPGCSIFLVARTPGDWSHTGLVTDFSADHFTTVEGNTNDEGSRNGYEVCSRIRGYTGKDFIRIV
jgi:hypothetical protein